MNALNDITEEEAQAIIIRDLGIHYGPAVTLVQGVWVHWYHPKSLCGKRTMFSLKSWCAVRPRDRKAHAGFDTRRDALNYAFDRETESFGVMA